MLHDAARPSGPVTVARPSIVAVTAPTAAPVMKSGPSWRRVRPIGMEHGTLPDEGETRRTDQPARSPNRHFHTATTEPPAPSGRFEVGYAIRAGRRACLIATFAQVPAAPRARKGHGHRVRRGHPSGRRPRCTQWRTPPLSHIFWPRLVVCHHQSGRSQRNCAGDGPRHLPGSCGLSMMPVS